MYYNRLILYVYNVCTISQLASVKANEGKPQEEQVPIRPFTQTEEIVLDILGKGSGTTQKTEVDLSDFPVQGTVRVRTMYKLYKENYLK